MSAVVTVRNLRKQQRRRKRRRGLGEPMLARDTLAIDGFSPWSEREALAFRMGVILGQQHQSWGDVPPRHERVGRRLAAIFAADVAGYSRLMGRDEAGTMRALFAARARLGGAIVEHGGRVANAVGDSVLAEFGSAVDAVQCAMVVQERLAEADAAAAEGLHLPFRIAVHVGDIVPSGSDIFGDGINVCARLQELAQPRGICISGAAYHYVRKALSVAFDDLGERTLKNIDEPVRVFAIRPAARAVLRRAQDEGRAITSNGLSPL